MQKNEMLAQNAHKEAEAVNPSPFDSTQSHERRRMVNLPSQLPPPCVPCLRTQPPLMAVLSEP
jgi:hypothetical protein